MPEFIFFISAISVGTSLWIYLRSVGGGIKSSAANRYFSFQALYLGFTFFLVPALHVITRVYSVPEAYFYEWTLALTKLNGFVALGLMLAAAVAMVARPLVAVRQAPAARAKFTTIGRIALPVSLIGIALYVGLLLSGSDQALLQSPLASTREERSILVFMFIENVPILLTWTLLGVLVQRRVALQRSHFWIAVGFIALVALALSGLRGSRVSVLLQIFACIITLDFYYRLVKKRDIIVLGLSACAFLYVFAHYKYGGYQGLIDLASGAPTPAYIQRYLNPVSIILSDLGRSDVQALIIQRVLDGQFVPPYTGATYISALLSPLPDIFSPAWAIPKTVLGAQALYQSSQILYIEERLLSSSRIYGLIGEATLNFGWLGLIIAFAPLAVIHAKSIAWLNFCAQNSRGLFVPLFVLAPILIVFYDLDNVVFYVIKSWSIPAAIYIAASWLDGNAMRHSPLA